MKQLTITIHVQPAAAIRAGKSQCGECPLVLSDTDLATLTETQREILAKHVERKTGYPDPFFGREASVSELARLLDERETKVQREAKEATEREVIRAREFAKEKEEQEVFLAPFRTCPVADLIDGSTERYVRLPHGYFSESLAQKTGRTEEVREELAKRRAAKIAADKATMLNILQLHAPDVIPVFLAGRARSEDLEKARRAELAKLCRVELCKDQRVAKEIEGMSPPLFARFEALQKQCVVVPDAEVTVYGSWRAAREDEEGDDDGEVADYSLPVATIKAEIAGESTVITVPI